jgi:hypothetical protein
VRFPDQEAECPPSALSDQFPRRAVARLPRSTPAAVAR